MESVVVELLLGKIVSILENEASLIGGVRDALNEIKLELITMTSFLEDADRTKSLTERERSWVADVRDKCYSVEDIIEEFMYHLHNDKRRDGKLVKLLHGAIHLPKNLWIRHRIAKDIQGINKSLKSIPERNQRYSGIQNERHQEIDDDQTREQFRSELLANAKDKNVVGIEDEKKQMLEWLTDGKAERTVISVVGMGGCGKSTLVAKVYNDQIVRCHFDCFAWVTLSQKCFIDDLLRRIINKLYHSDKKDVPVELSSMDRTDLATYLINHLQSKKCLIVLDDVWRNNLWQDLEIILSDEGFRSRLILTTRNDEIANTHFGVRSHVLHVKPLEDREAWDLFSSTAFFTNENRACPEEIESIARDLVRKCNGLPLAILALGGVMSSKKMDSEWSDFQANLHHELSSNDDFEELKKRILLFSFKDLSYRLKQCFLYCCIFPEDYTIKRKRLIKLWMAEGFIKRVGGTTPEAVADNYLLQLVHRNMLQVVERNPRGRPKKCKMHDMMRELALSISQQEKFSTVYDSEDPGEGGSVRACRLSIQTDSINKVKSLNRISKLRSLIVFISDTIYPSPETNSLPSGFRFLRVLDLQDVPVDKLPKELVNLFNLRYLNLRGTKVKELPRSITRLRNLETLDIRNTEIEALPAGIVELKKLRHLKMDGILVPRRICELKDLQTLDGVEAPPWLLKEIKGMTQLTSISMKVYDLHQEDLWAAIGHMKHLRHISVSVTSFVSLYMDALPNVPPYLKRLYLQGRMNKVPSWFYSLRNLTKLQLHGSLLYKDPLPSIQSLPYLHHLILNQAYEHRQLCFSSGFKNLKCLELVNMGELYIVSIREGVMPSIKQLVIFRCFLLKTVPEGIEHLYDLEELILNGVSDELLESMSGEQSEDRQRVRHIPKILLSSGWGEFENLARID